MQAATTCRTIQRGEPPTRIMHATVSSNTEPQRKRSIIHALVRADVKGDPLMQPSSLSLPTTRFTLA